MRYALGALQEGGPAGPEDSYRVATEDNMRFRELLDKARGLWAEYDPKPDTSDRMVMGVDSEWNVRLYEGFYVYALRAAAVDERQRVHEPVVEFDRIGGGHSDLTPENYMKYQGEIAEHPSGTLKEGWWMVVEEPEAHVHPEGQATIARFMAKLARLGVNVMATTHSDIIALKLAQMVGLADLSPEERERFGYRGDEYLTKEELALYSFEPTEDGSMARKIDVSETGEVSELPTYSNVVEEMYGEAVRLLELHGKIPKVDEEP